MTVRGGEAEISLRVSAGGRVAVWCGENKSSIADNVFVDAGCFDGKRYTEPTTTAEPGTIYWGDLPCPGTAILVR